MCEIYGFKMSSSIAFPDERTTPLAYNQPPVVLFSINFDRSFILTYDPHSSELDDEGKSSRVGICARIMTRNSMKSSDLFIFFTSPPHFVMFKLTKSTEHLAAPQRAPQSSTAAACSCARRRAGARCTHSRSRRMGITTTSSRWSARCFR